MTYLMHSKHNCSKAYIDRFDTWLFKAHKLDIIDLYSLDPVVDNDEQETEEFLQPHKYVGVTISAQIEASKTGI